MEETPEKQGTMKQRFITGLLLVIFLAVMLWLPNWCMALATLVCVCFAVWEEYHALVTAGPLATLICVCFAVWEEYHALVTAGHRVVTWPTWISLVTSIPLTYFFGVKAIVPLLALALLIMVTVILFRKEPELTDLSMSALPLLTVALPGLSLVAISLLPDQKAVEVVLLCLTFAVPLVGDIFALLAGSAIGGPKLCEAVSPKKTIAGSIGGLAGSVLAAMAVYGLSLVCCNEPTPTCSPATAACWTGWTAFCLWRC